MPIKIERFQKDFVAISEFGKNPKGGVTRLALSSVDLEARRYLKEQMLAAGLEVHVDGIGNMRGIRKGTEDLPPVIIGSHLDTVPKGGHFDGVTGVLAALEIIRSLNDLQVTTRRPIEIINFTAEESSRFGVATLGSKALTGHLTQNDLVKLADQKGVTLREALEKAGLSPTETPFFVRQKGDIHAFLELHIEQGPVLEGSHYPLGIVTAIAAPARLRVGLKGRADHSGTTPMGERRDALAGAAEIILGVERIATNEAGKTTVATVGFLRASPGVMNVVPGMVEFGVDLRDTDLDARNLAKEKIIAMIRGVAARRKLAIKIEHLGDEIPVALSERIIGILEHCASSRLLDYHKMPSGAGHDAMNLASIAETGMIFIPSVGGISHNPEEKSRLEDILTGTQLLYDATLALAQEP